MSEFVELLIFLPLVGALIGYTTKSVAVQLIFKPSEFVGFGPVGWQGVVQRRAPKFAAGVADTLTSDAVRADELFTGIDVDGLVPVVAAAVVDADDGSLRALVAAAAPAEWDVMDEEEKRILVQDVRDGAPALVRSVVEHLQPAAPEALDLRGLVIDMLSGPNADRLARLARRIGGRELQFLVWYGALLGFLIGLAEVGVYSWLGQWWLLPLVGAIDGVVNNWLAIQMIFRPLERRRYLGVFPYQGMFPARQKEIAKDYAALLADEVLTIDILLARAFEPARLNAVLDLIAEPVTAFIREQPSLTQHSTAGAAGGVAVATAAAPSADVGVGAAFLPLLAPVVPAVVTQLKEDLDLGAMLEERLAAMPKLEFERVLRGIFEEDETTLIIIGGVLGAAIGALQAALVVTTGLGV